MEKKEKITIFLTIFLIFKKNKNPDKKRVNHSLFII